MKKRFKVLAVIMTTCVILMTSALSVFADGAGSDDIPFYKIWDGYYCPSIIKFSQPNELYPDGSEVSGPRYTVAVSSKVQYSDAKAETLNIGYQINWDVKKYVEITPQTIPAVAPNEYADLSTWNRVMKLTSGYDQYYSTFRGEIVDKYIEGLPMINLRYDDIIYSKEYHSKYNYMTYMRMKTDTYASYFVEVTGDVSSFNNVTGEMVYLENVRYTATVTPTENNGVYTAEFKLLSYLKSLADSQQEQNLAHLQNVDIRITPTSSTGTGEVQEVAFSSPLKTDDWYTIQDVWNTENEAFNWWNFTDWITIAINGFLSFELMPGISLIGIVGALVGLSIFIYFLKVFAGG